MKLSELLEISPMAYVEAKKETIKKNGLDYWDQCISVDVVIGACFAFPFTDNYEMWEQIADNDTTLLKQWEAEQIANQTK